MIENLGATMDQFDTLELSDNEITKLDNFPRFTRLRTIILNNNFISRISSSIGSNVPNLENLVLTNNKIINFIRQNLNNKIINL